MLATEMIVAHSGAMDTARRALHAEQTAGGRPSYLSLSRKLMALFTAQMDALNRYRGKIIGAEHRWPELEPAPGRL
jgi:hypothetical protein